MYPSVTGRLMSRGTRRSSMLVDCLPWSHFLFLTIYLRPNVLRTGPRLCLVAERCSCAGLGGRLTPPSVREVSAWRALALAGDCFFIAHRPIAVMRT